MSEFRAKPRIDLCTPSGSAARSTFVELAIALVAVAGVLVGTSHPALADVQLWSEAGVSKRATKRLQVELSLQTRFDQDISRLQALLPEVGVRYRAIRWLRVGGGYRLEYERDNNGDLVVRHRVSAYARASYTVKRVRLDYRLMVVEQWRPSSNDQYRTVLRNRVDVSYRDLGPWTPGVSAEVFHALGDLDQADYDKLRLTAGVSLERKQHSIDVFYRAELHADPAEPTFHILGLGYHFDL
ncbi:MAG: DUF2490 domain-containing protein [Kofleriaceae bacterium]